MPISQGCVDLSGLVTQEDLAEAIAASKCIEFELNNVYEITIAHGRGYIPAYQLRNENGRLVEVPITHIDKNNLTIYSVLPITGTLYIY